ncbi:hypothetical protein ABVN23_21795 [Pseudomonas fluorescens]|uniref:hypothetical protein n=1 Tax=Pseudomonas fluorescens TaxID=294 RepID=UPI003F968E7A
MRKIAFFVEGAAEVLFIEKLISEVANSKEVYIAKKKIRGGGKSGVTPKRYTEYEGVRELSGENFYVLIYDCGGDKLVATRIREEHASLTQAGYEQIVGVRDVRPDFEKVEIPKLEHFMHSVVDKALAPVVFILSTMEVEAWFLAEYNHYEKVHPELNSQLIMDSLGFDPRTFVVSDRANPAQDLENSYLLKGVVYDKYLVQNTVDKLDFAFVYEELVQSISELSSLASTVDKFLTKPADI